ncbi:unnamed protein product, partial [Ectocarpus sp. 4 AP-2014]
LPDPRQTVSRYWRTRTNLRGADGSRDTIYEVRSFGNTLGGFDAQRERGFDAQLQTLDALTPFRHNPYLFFGGMQGFGYGTPGYPAAVPGTPPAAATGPAPGQPGTAWPYAPQGNVVIPPYPFGLGYGYGYGHPGYGRPDYGRPGGRPGHGYERPWWGYGPGRE